MFFRNYPQFTFQFFKYYQLPRQQFYFKKGMISGNLFQGFAYLGLIAFVHQTLMIMDSLDIWDREINRRLERKQIAEDFLRMGSQSSVNMSYALSQYQLIMIKFNKRYYNFLFHKYGPEYQFFDENNQTQIQKWKELTIFAQIDFYDKLNIDVKNEIKKQIDQSWVDKVMKEVKEWQELMTLRKDFNFIGSQFVEKIDEKIFEYDLRVFDFLQIYQELSSEVFLIKFNQLKDKLTLLQIAQIFSKLSLDKPELSNRVFQSLQINQDPVADLHIMIGLINLELSSENLQILEKIDKNLFLLNYEDYREIEVEGIVKKLLEIQKKFATKNFLKKFVLQKYHTDLMKEKFNLQTLINLYDLFPEEFHNKYLNTQIDEIKKNLNTLDQTSLLKALLFFEFLVKQKHISLSISFVEDAKEILRQKLQQDWFSNDEETLTLLSKINLPDFKFIINKYKDK